MTIEQLKGGFKSGTPFFCAALTQIPCIFDRQFEANEILLLSNLFVGAVLFGFEYQYLNYTNIPEYKEYVELYEEFISDIAKMYRELGFKGDFTASLAYKLCLESGIFSARPVQYTIYENDCDRLIKYCGGRVATGAYCCRHNASLLSDILTKMGGIAPKISVFTSEETMKRKFLPDHLVTGVLHENKRLVIDPTMGIGGVFLFENEYNSGINTMISSSDFRYYMTYASRFAKEKDNKKITKEFMQYKPIANFDELIEFQFECLAKVSVYQDEYEAFHEEEKPKILQLARLSDVVASHGKEKVN